MKTFTLLLLFTATLCSSVAKAQYCMLPGRTVYSSEQPGITNFKLRAIDRTSSNVEGPLSAPSLVVTTDSTVLERGKTYVVTITHSKDNIIFPNARNNIRVWLDYDQNTDFADAGEAVISADFITAGIYTDSFTVPATAKLGVTRLRATAKMSSDAGHTIPTPCDEPKDPLDYHGEIEDYTITIVAEGTDVKDVSENTNTVSLYPNPTKGIITVALGRAEQEVVAIDLYDITGKRIAALLHEKQQAESYQFHLGSYNIEPGVYFVKVVSGNTVSYERVVKVN